MTSKIRIVSRAFVRLGRAPVNDLETGGDVVAAVADEYQDTVNCALASFTWSFALNTLQLSQLTAMPPHSSGYRYAYELPADLLELKRVHPYSRYEIFGSKLFCDASEVTVDYVYQADESFFPAYFTNFVVSSLAASVCMFVTNNLQLKDSLTQEASRFYSIATYLNSRERRPRIIRSNPFVIARF